MIPYGRQDINEEDLRIVIETLKSDFLTQGPMVPKFENCLSQYTGASYCFAMNSATSALHVACLALGVKKGDTVWTSPITFVASANAALYCGANVKFVDIDSRTFNLCPEALESELVQAEKLGSLPKVVIPVHLAGQSCDMEKIHNLSLRFGFKIIEDASHAIGGTFNGAKVGSCRYSDITIFSFHPVKIITTAEGGMLLSNSSEIAIKVELLRSHGITRKHELMEGVSHGSWYYEQIELGYNYRMTDLQAALGLSQMSRLDEFVDKRNNIASFYTEKLSDLPLRLPVIDFKCKSSFHLYIIRLNLKRITKSHREVFEELRRDGVGVNIHYIPVYKQPYYRRLGYSDGNCPEADRYYSEAISIPMFPSLSEKELGQVVKSLRNVLES